MEPRLIRTLAVIVVLLLLALTAFTLMLRRYRVLSGADGGRLRAGAVSSTGMPPSRPYMQGVPPKHAFESPPAPAATTATVDAAAQGDAGTTTAP